MVGLTHSAFRSTLLAIGGVGLFYSEMLAARRLPHDNPRCSPLLIRSEAEKPFFYQIVTSDPGELARAVDKLHALDAQGFDLNLGCPAPMVVKQGCGQALLDDKTRLVKVVKELRRLTDLPLSVKIRLGDNAQDDSVLDDCRLFCNEGIDLICVHARYRGEKFCRKPKWSMVRRIKRAVPLPIMVNGGIFSVQDAQLCLSQSEADGLMIGRGAVIRPSLCREVAEAVYGIREKNQPWSNEQTVLYFISQLESRFPQERRLGRLKQFTHYFSQSIDFGHHLASAVQSSSSFAMAIDRVHQFFAIELSRK